MYQYLLLFEGLIGFLVFGLVTGLVGGLAARVEEDVKKIIAYSTLSQLGFILVVIGISFELRFIHLLTHAFFKSSLFISFGLTIILNHSQREANFRAEGGAGIKLLGILRIFSLISFPFYLSFFSKHLVLRSMRC